MNLDIVKIDATELKEAILKHSTRKNGLILVATLSSSYVVYKAIKFYLKKRKYRHIPGPPTEGLFGYFVGNVPEIKEYVKTGKIFPDLLLEWHQTYGEVFKFQVTDRIFVVTTDKNTIRDVLILKNYPKSEEQRMSVGYPLSQRFLGDGLLTAGNYLNLKRPMTKSGSIAERCSILDFIENKLRSKADGKTVVKLMHEINRTTLDAIALIAFGMQTDAINREELPLNMYLTKILGFLFDSFIDPLFQKHLFKFKPWNLSKVKDFEYMIQYVRKMGKDKIMERLNAYKNNEHIPNDILSSILANYKEKDLDIETMTDDFVTFFIAGQETTANTLSFCFLEMGKNPEIVKKARDEIDRVLGERTEVTYQDVNELKYCAAIFKESLRLYPPATHLFRNSPEKIIINELEIPKGTHIAISTYVNCRCEREFKNALEFKPERFLKNGHDEEIVDSGNGNYAYLPFSLGPRNCIGKNFAKLEGVIVIAKLLQKFDFKLDPTQSFDIEQNGTLRPKDGTRCFITLRA